MEISLRDCIEIFQVHLMPYFIVLLSADQLLLTLNKAPRPPRPCPDLT